jgi:hypothetical protein
MATLTVTVSESVVLQGRNHGTTNTKSITGVTEVFKRIVNLDATNEVTLYTCSAALAEGGSSFDSDTLKYSRITNIGSNVVILIVGTKSNAGTVVHQLAVGASFLIFDHQGSFDMAAADIAKAAVALSTPADDIAIVTAYSASSAGSVEVLVCQ